MSLILQLLRIGVAAALLFAAIASPASESEPGTIRLQLKWSHQFQFAGYYAALEKGFFREEGLAVEIIEGNADRPPLDVVLSGKADFGVTDGDVLHARMQGSPVVVCAAIFQHSPYIVMSRHDSGIRVPSDLIDRTVMISDDQGGVQHLAMLKREGLPIDRIKIVPHTWKLDDLIEGRVDAISAYVTAEPSQMRARGVEPHFMKASDYGIDFYGDTLFTREEIVKERPAEVEAMIRATRRGWHYALEHRAELIAHILTLPGVRERGITAANLNDEAEAMEPLIRADLVEIGHMNPGRWVRMARTYEETGLAQPPRNPAWLQGFLYRPPGEARPLVSLAPCIGIATLAAFIVLVWITTLRRKVEQRTKEIQRSAETHRLILDSALDAVIGVGRDELVVEWHPRATEIFGVPEAKALGTAIPRFLPGLRRHLGASGKPVGENRFELEARRADGTRFPVELSVSVLPKDREVSLILFVRDITGQRSLEEKLRQSQKMQAIGQLAGGIAHDFNNLLTVIRGNATIIREEAHLEPEHGGALDEILAAGERASSLTAQLLAFSRQQPMQPKVFAANPCIENIVRMLGRLIGEDVRIETRLSSPSPILRADQAMIEQVILNLAVNGRDAMPHGGVLSLSTRVVPVSGDLARIHHREKGGDYLCIEVRDTGTGIAPEHLPRVFEPFFTTKEVGKGTGLGLATVFGIVEQHGGWVTVESRLGEGSTFTVWLPCHREAEATETAPQRLPAGSSRDTAPGGHETILLVEDEDLVRLVGRRLLTRQGYRVIEARNGRHALELWKDHANEIDLLLTDVVMPEGISGQELAKRLQSERPGLKVVYTSGYAAEIFRGEASLPSDAAFVGKPYRPEELLGTIRSVLDGNPVEPLALPS